MPAGRPTKYDPSFNERARKACSRFNATDQDLAELFDVSISSIKQWKNDYPLFSAAVKEGKDECDDRVEQSLYHRAMGYSHKAVKIFADPKSGAEKVVEYTERFPPDPTSMIFWLKNRRRAQWRDKHEVEATGADGKPLVPETDPVALGRALALALATAGKGAKGG